MSIANSEVFVIKQGSYGNGGDQFKTPIDATTDASGNVNVADNGNSRSQVSASDISGQPPPPNLTVNKEVVVSSTDTGKFNLAINGITNSEAIQNLVYLKQLSVDDPPFSIQQNFFVAAPNGTIIYWVQNIVLVSRVGTVLGERFVYNRFQVFGMDDLLHPVVNEYLSILAHKDVVFPTAFNLTSYIDWENRLILRNNASRFFDSASLELPAGSYIVGYSGSDGGYPQYSHLSPELVLVGNAWLRTAAFHEPTSGSVQSNIRLVGESSWRSVKNMVLNLRSNTTQTAEESLNLKWYPDGAFEYSPLSDNQGISFRPP